MAKPQRPRSLKRIRDAIKPIKPEMDIQGVIVRNDAYINMLIGLRTLLPMASSNVEALVYVTELIDDLGNVPRTLSSLNYADRKMANHTAKLYLVLQKEWNKLSDPDIKRALRGYLDKVKAMGTDLSKPRAEPRNMKEVLARNFLGLQPQDVRTKGLGSSYLKETARDFKVLFGANAADFSFKKVLGDEAATQKSRRENEMRKLHEEAIEDNHDFDAVRQQKAAEKDKIHEQAMSENRQRDNALFEGRPFVQDAIRDKELIHAQALEEDSTDAQRTEQKQAEEQRQIRRVRAERESAYRVEDQQDDTVSSEMLKELKAIHSLLEEKETGKGKAKKQPEVPEDTKEEQILQIMKSLGYKGNDPIGRKFAENIYNKGTKTQDGVVVPKIDEKDRDHEHALEIDERINRKSAEAKYVHDREEAHAQALKTEAKIEHGRALSINARIDQRLKEKNFVQDKDVAHEMALKTNANIDRLNNAPQQAQATPVAPTPQTAPEATEEEPEAGGGVMEKARGVLGGLARFAGTAAVAAGGIMGGWKIGSWMNRNLGLRSAGERMNEAENARALEVTQRSNEVAREHGFNSFAEMQTANRTTRQRNENRQRALVENMERMNIEESLYELQTDVNPPQHVTNNYMSNPPTAPQTTEPQIVFIRPVHPSLMRFQDKRISRTLFPQNTM